jgi:hypothetical protein
MQRSRRFQRAPAFLADQYDLGVAIRRMRTRVGFQERFGDTSCTFGLPTQSFVVFAHIEEQRTARQVLTDFSRFDFADIHAGIIPQTILQ